MKKLIVILILIIVAKDGYCKNNKSFDEKYRTLLEFISYEDWTKSEKLCKELLPYAEGVDTMEIEKKVLRYIYIYCTAGLLNEKKLTQQQALEKVMFLKSKEMILPSHPFNSKCYVNCTHLSDDTLNTFFTGVNNKNGTQIFSFEYVVIKNGIKEKASDLEGKYITLRGELNEISVEGHMFPRFKLKFINGDYIVSEK